MMVDGHVPIHSADDLVMARRAGALAADVLEMIAEHVRPGVTTDELDRLCHDHIVNVQQAIPANIGYHGYPKTICASVNHVICHGIPSSKQLKNGGHHQHRRRAHQGRLVWRHQPYVFCRPTRHASQATGTHDL